MRTLYVRQSNVRNRIYFWQPSMSDEQGKSYTPSKKEIKRQNRSNSMEGNVKGLIRKTLGIKREDEKLNPNLKNLVSNITKTVVESLKIKSGIVYGKNYEDLSSKIIEIVDIEKQKIQTALA